MFALGAASVGPSISLTVAIVAATRSTTSPIPTASYDNNFTAAPMLILAPAYVCQPGANLSTCLRMSAGC